ETDLGSAIANGVKHGRLGGGLDRVMKQRQDPTRHYANPLCDRRHAAQKSDWARAISAISAQVVFRHLAELNTNLVGSFRDAYSVPEVLRRTHFLGTSVW